MPKVNNKYVWYNYEHFLLPLKVWLDGWISLMLTRGFNVSGLKIENREILNKSAFAWLDDKV